MTVPVPVSAAKAATETSKQRDNQNDDENDTERRHEVSPLWNGTPSHANQTRVILASRFAAMASRYGASASRSAGVIDAENSPTVIPRLVRTGRTSN
jgi:hypothetical protein